MILAYGAISSAPHSLSDLPVAVLVCGGSALFSTLVGVVGIVLRDESLADAWRRAGRLRLYFRHHWQPAWMGLAVVVSGSLAYAFGIGHPYWAMVAALAPLSAAHITSQLTRAVHRSVGTLMGLVPATILLAAQLPSASMVLAIALCQLGAELWVGRNYAVAMLAITPLALLMGQLASPHPIGPLLFDRGVETVIGSIVGMLLALAGHQLRERRVLRHEQRQEQLV